MSTVDRLAPYVERLLDDDDLQRSIEHSLVRGRQAFAGALSKGSPKKAATDRRVRARARASVLAARHAIGTLQRAPELERRRRRRRRALVVACVAGIFGAGALAMRGAGAQPSEQPAGQR